VLALPNTAISWLKREYEVFSSSIEIVAFRI
jgi:hypothetical protein